MRIIWESPNYDGPMPLEAFAPLEDFDPIDLEEVAEVEEVAEDVEETQYQPPAGTGFGW